jgi:inositol phosphorylceramide mannosyltransferase catalytic subunit
VIPRILHQIWVGPDPIPAEYAAYMDGWARMHPGWEHRVWTDENLPAMRNRDLYDRAEELTPYANVGQFRADLLRYELLWSFGGVYVDVDFECLEPIDELTAGLEAFAAWEVQDRWIANGIMGAEPAHPFIDRLITGLPASVAHHRGLRPNVSTGPQYLTGLWRRHRDELTVLDANLFYPYLYHQVGTPAERGPWPESTIAVHHWANRRRTLARSRR